MIDKQSQIRRASNLISRLIRSNCYGKVTINMEAGNIVFIEIDENKRVSLQEAVELLSRLTSDNVGSILIRPTRSGSDTGILLVTEATRGSLEHVVPVGVKE